MAITLDAIDLPIDLIWSDEHGWSNVVQNIKKSLTGALVIQEASQAKGRLITLVGGSDSAWISRTTLEALKVKYDTPDLTMTLTFHGTPYTVMFNRSGNTSPVESKEIYDLADPDADHIYSITLKFIEV